MLSESNLITPKEIISYETIEDNINLKLLALINAKKRWLYFFG